MKQIFIHQWFLAGLLVGLGGLLYWLSTIFAVPATNIEWEEISLSKCYSTPCQEGTTAIEEKFDQSNVTYMKIFHATVGWGASNLFLAKADSIEDAFFATKGVVFGTERVDEAVVGGEGKNAENYWAIVFFGSGSTDDEWILESVKRHEGHIQIRYRKGRPTNADVWPYFCWIPVGVLEPGACTLELIDADQKRTVLIRKVRINK